MATLEELSLFPGPNTVNPVALITTPLQQQVNEMGTLYERLYPFMVEGIIPGSSGDFVHREDLQSTIDTLVELVNAQFKIINTTIAGMAVVFASHVHPTPVGPTAVSATPMIVNPAVDIPPLAIPNQQGAGLVAQRVTVPQVNDIATIPFRARFSYIPPIPIFSFSDTTMKLIPL